MDLCQDHRGIMGTMEYISTDRVEMHYRIPLAEIVFDFFDQLKSRTKGYASLEKLTMRTASRPRTSSRSTFSSRVRRSMRSAPSCIATRHTATA